MTGSVQVRRNKLWTVVYLGNNKYDWRNTGLDVKGNKREAEKLLRQHIFEFESKEDFSLQNILFTEYLLVWLDEMKGKVRPNTHHQYELVVKNNIIPYFEPLGLKLRNLQPIHIQRYYNNKTSDGVSANTIKHYHANIHKALKHAVRFDLIPNNPADRIELPKVERYIGNFYTAEQVIAILELVKGTIIETPVLLTAVYGLRRSEAVGLKWDAVDFKRQTITIKHTIVGTGRHQSREDYTKTNSSTRTLHLTDEVSYHLKKHKANQRYMKYLYRGNYLDDDYVCTWEDGRLISPEYLSKKFVALVKKSDLPVYRYHDLRHSAASLLVSDGKSLKQIGEFLGHSNPTTTNRYTHLQFQSTIDLAQAVTSKLFPLKQSIEHPLNIG